MKNELLFARMKKLVATERRIGTAILDGLAEIDRRRAYAELRYDGLYSYCVKELGFSEAQAYQRIQAMRALRELPDLKSKIDSGALSVSAVAKVQTHLRQEKKEGRARSAPERLVLFVAMENRTSREVEARLAHEKGEEIRAKLVLEMDAELAALWEEAKNLAAHRSGGDAAKVLKILAREWIERNRPDREVRTAKAPLRSPSADRAPPARRAVPFPGRVAAMKDTQVHRPAISPENRRAPKAELRRQVWRRDGGKCTKCSSKHALEIDHIVPFACGGETREENLRLLCRSCNQATAAKTFGRRIKIGFSKT
jgi:5-methylcytosine-specific restriction endonuclease McrA